MAFIPRRDGSRAGRCASAFWLVPHDPMLRRRRGADGRAEPHVIEWECRRCGRTVGTTELEPRWSLLARLRRQRPSPARRTA